MVIWYSLEYSLFSLEADIAFTLYSISQFFVQTIFPPPPIQKVNSKDFGSL
jgi:hypothetical protein